MNWALCVICQKKTSEELRCPLINPLDVYNAFVKNVEEFKKLDCLPVEIDIKDGQVLMEYHAKWHYAQDFTYFMLFSNSQYLCLLFPRKYPLFPTILSGIQWKKVILHLPACSISKEYTATWNCIAAF